MITHTIEGNTPEGHPFAIRSRFDAATSKITSRCLEWLPFGGVGSITVPMRAECWIGQLFYELTRHGVVSIETARNCFTT